MVQHKLGKYLDLCISDTRMDREYIIGFNNSGKIHQDISYSCYFSIGHSSTNHKNLQAGIAYFINSERNLISKGCTLLDFNR